MDGVEDILGEVYCLLAVGACPSKKADDAEGFGA